MEPSDLTFDDPAGWPALMTPGEVAALLRFAETTVIGWCRDGKLEATQLGSKWRIPREAVWRLLPPSTLESWGDGPWRRDQRE